MKGLIFILNRVCFFLEKVNNQSSLLGSVILVSILISLLVLDVQLCVFTFKERAVNLQNLANYIGVFLIFVFLLFFAKNNKKQIMDHSTNISRLKDICVLMLYLGALGAFIFLSNINREKIFKERSMLINRNKN